MSRRPTTRAGYLKRLIPLPDFETRPRPGTGPNDDNPNVVTIPWHQRLSRDDVAQIRPGLPYPLSMDDRLLALCEASASAGASGASDGADPSAAGPSSASGTSVSLPSSGPAGNPHAGEPGPGPGEMAREMTFHLWDSWCGNSVKWVEMDFVMDENEDTKGKGRFEGQGARITQLRVARNGFFLDEVIPADMDERAAAEKRIERVRRCLREHFDVHLTGLWETEYVVV